MNITDVACLEDEDMEAIKGLVFKDLQSICIFTGSAASKHQGDGQIYLKIEGKHPYFDEPIIVADHDEWFELCECGECSSYDKDLWEYYSIFVGLKIAQTTFPNIPVTLRVDSDAFLADATDGFYHSDRSSCPTRNDFMEELFELLRTVGIAETENTCVFKNSSSL